MTEGILECNSVQINYRKYGAGDEKPLVLLHGNGEDGRIFDVAAQKFAEGGFTVYAPDSRSHGKSGKAPLSYADMAEDVRAFIENLQLEKPMLYGFSDGGIIGLILAMRNPGLLSKLAVSGANLAPGALKFSFRFGIRVSHFFTRDPMLALMLREPQISPSDLARITEPTLVLAGERDIIPQKHTESVAAAIPSATLCILIGEDHASYVVDGEKLYRTLRDFFV
ncbi:MAG: alpha/beta hydrolase [Firmicutes bacterium]|nr:alpha/beta hydrolase [Bacillota bacterium]